MSIRKETHQLNIGNVGEDYLRRFKEMCTDKRVSARELFIDMFDAYQAGEKNMTAQERELLNQAVEASNTDSESFKKIAILEKAHRMLRQNKRTLKMGDEYIGKTKGADLKAFQFLEKMFDHNDAATDAYNKIYINSRSLSKFSNNSLNQEVVKRCLIAHAQKIEDHHHRHHLNPNHNRDCALRLRLLKKEKD